MRKITDEMAVLLDAVSGCVAGHRANFTSNTAHADFADALAADILASADAFTDDQFDPAQFVMDCMPRAWVGSNKANAWECRARAWRA
jgi:hypothetical protein